MEGITATKTLVLFGINLMLQLQDDLEDKKITLAEGIALGTFAAFRLPQVYNAAKKVVAEFNDLQASEIEELRLTVQKELRIDGQPISSERALYVIDKAFALGLAVMEFKDSFTEEIPKDLENLLNEFVATTDNTENGVS